MSRFPLFDTSEIQLRGISSRGCELTYADVLPLEAPDDPLDGEDFLDVVRAILKAQMTGRPIILMMGGHPIKLGLSRFIIDLIDQRMITHIAMNGSGLIHDYELAAGYGTSEDVAKWIRVGQFGLWYESGELNLLIKQAANNGYGIGEAAGEYIQEAELPHCDVSVLAAAYRKEVPATVHVGIGCDIIHAHHSFSGKATGAASHTDFLMFANTVSRLEGGVFLNVGTSVFGPEVYLKALSMARNVAHQRREQICNFTTAVFDTMPLPPDTTAHPGKDDPLYYYRPWKTILSRTIADGGSSYYICGDHTHTIPSLWAALGGVGGL